MHHEDGKADLGPSGSGFSGFCPTFHPQLPRKTGAVAPPSMPTPTRKLGSSLPPTSHNLPQLPTNRSLSEIVFGLRKRSIQALVHPECYPVSCSISGLIWRLRCDCFLPQRMNMKSLAVWGLAGFPRLPSSFENGPMLQISTHVRMRARWTGCNPTVLRRKPGQSPRFTLEMCCWGGRSSLSIDLAPIHHPRRFPGKLVFQKTPTYGSHHTDSVL